MKMSLKCLQHILEGVKMSLDPKDTFSGHSKHILQACQWTYFNEALDIPTLGAASSEGAGRPDTLACRSSKEHTGGGNKT